MAGPAPQQPPISATPYGHQQPMPAMPAYDPRMGKRPGSTATKVWGIILLILGAFGILGLISSIAMMFGGMNTAQFTPNLAPEAQAEMQRMQETLINDALGRVTFWMHTVIEAGIALLSFAAGLFLVLKPRPMGAKLALARVALVLLSLPIYAYETDVTMQSTMASQEAMMRLQFEAERKKHGGKGPNTDEMMDTMGTFMRGAGYGTMVITIIFILVINGVLAFQMSRPHIKEYLASVQGEKDVIPGYDPSMGLMMPPPGQAPPGAMPPGPPQQGAPPGR